MTKLIINFLLGCSVLILIVLQLHNAISYPITQGFDGRAHLEYIDYLLVNKSIPLSSEGWELFQPPLYYLVAVIFSILFNLKILGFLLYTFLCIIVYLFLIKINSLYKVSENNVAVRVAFLLTMATPVVIYLPPMISNEFFFTVLASFSLFYYIFYYVSDPINNKKIYILGILLGLLLISKATALVLIAAIVADQLLKSRVTLSKQLLNIFLVLLIAVSIGGWFYLRNIIYFGNPLYQPADYIPLSNWVPGVVERDIDFLFNPQYFLTTDFFSVHFKSLPAGTYFTWYYEGQGAFLPKQAFSKAGLVIVLFSIPIFATAVWGFISHLWQNKFSILNFQSSILYLYTFLLLIAYLYYNFKLPLPSTVKASFMSSLILPYSYFLLQGISKINHKIKNDNLVNAVLILFSCVYILFIAKHFWVDPAWY